MASDLRRDVQGVLLADLLSRQRPLVVINLGVGLASALVFAHPASYPTAAGWFAGIAALQGFRLVLPGYLTRAELSQERKLQALTALSAMSGAGWAVLALLFYQPGPAAHQSYIQFVLAGMAAGSIAALAAHPPAFLAFLACSLVPHAVQLALLGTGETLMMGLVTVAYALGLAYLGRQTHAIQRRSATLHLRNARLVGRLRAARDELEQRVAVRTASLRASNIALSEEIEQRRRTEERVRHLVGHDVLTNLPNRLLLVDRLEQAIGRARRAGSRVAVALFDLDRFKEINDTHGHLAGDAVLVAMAERARAGLRSSDTVARLGGDEFAVIAPDLTSPALAGELGRKLMGFASRPVIAGELELRLSISVGIALYPDHAQSVQGLLSAADLALYEAKAAGRGRARLVTEELQSSARAQRRIGLDLRQALERDELRLVYQPRCLLESGRMVGAEALLRWQHPELGLLGPSHFILIAEASGLIRDIGQWVLATACREAAVLQGAGATLRIAVNLSALEFREPGLASKVQAHLERSGLAPSLLELEITESAFLDRSRGAVEADLNELVAVGIRIAIDDFGTGYSSLAYLSWLPVDIIKVDRGFVAVMLEDHRNTAIVQSIVTLAQALGKTVVAEGIETAAQLTKLRELGCGEGQGFLLSRPLSMATLRARLAGRADPMSAALEPDAAGSR